MTDLVWYAAYGSNLLRSRFMTYLEGGSFEGTQAAHRGARDRRPPQDDTRLDFEHQLFFAHESSRWGRGGVAFVDPDQRSTGCVITRAYLITAEQFEDVVAQENGWPTTSAIPFERIVADGRSLLGEGWYDLALHLGDHHDHPVLTFTTSRPMADLPLRPPAPAYIDTICRGLQELGVHVDDVVTYLERAPGVTGAMGHDHVVAAAQGPQP